MRTKTDHTYFLKLAHTAINGTRCAPPYVLEWEGPTSGVPDADAYAKIDDFWFKLLPTNNNEDWRGRYRLRIERYGFEPELTQFYHDPTCAFIEAEYIARALIRRSNHAT